MALTATTATYHIVILRHHVRNWLNFLKILHEFSNILQMLVIDKLLKRSNLTDDSSKSPEKNYLQLHWLKYRQQQMQQQFVHFFLEQFTKDIVRKVFYRLNSGFLLFPGPFSWKIMAMKDNIGQLKPTLRLLALKWITHLPLAARQAKSALLSAA
jgi:hypothetical protein